MTGTEHGRARKIATGALGKPLPPGVPIHHHHNEIIICESISYQIGRAHV